MWRARLCPSVLGMPVLALLLASGTGTAAAQETNREAAPARDSGSYRYWSFWEGSESGGWKYATEGPSVLRPEDGTALGFRFALSENSGDAAKPRGRADFGAVCERTGAKKDRKRIALSIDFGTSAHAPRGETPPKARTVCAQVADDASAAEALAAAAKPLRYNSEALLCAIEGYPERGCGEQVSGEEKDSGNGRPSGNGNGKDSGGESGGKGDGGLGPVAGIGAGIAGVAVLAAAAVRQSRRRR